jgi:hypothetical protein
MITVTMSRRVFEIATTVYGFYNGKYDAVGNIPYSTLIWASSHIGHPVFNNRGLIARSELAMRNNMLGISASTFLAISIFKVMDVDVPITKTALLEKLHSKDSSYKYEVILDKLCDKGYLKVSASHYTLIKHTDTISIKRLEKEVSRNKGKVRSGLNVKKLLAMPNPTIYKDGMYMIGV